MWAAVFGEQIMVTKFGKLLRKLRIDQGQVLKQMADTLNVSSAYLSAIELGKRNVPNDLVESISEKYNILDAALNEFREAAELSQSSIKVNLADSKDQNRETLLAFARKFNELDETQLKKINDVIK